MVTGNFWCIDCTCGKTSHDSKTFTAEIEDVDSKEKVYCPNNQDLVLKKMGIKTITIQTNDTRMKGRTAKDKAERRKKSWHSDVAPRIGLDRSEKKHFEKKFGKPK